MRSFAHLVGSIPAESAWDAMELAFDRLGPHLRWVPDGETGERRDWITHIVESCRDHPDLELRREGTWTDYDDVPVFRVRPGHELSADALELGHLTAFTSSYPVFRELREREGRPDVAFQVGIPGDLDLALFILGPSGPVRHRGPFREATLRELRAIHAQGGDDVVFQIEVPAELVLLTRAPTPAQPVLAAALARGIAELAAAAPEGARLGVHLCLGDMNHRALGRLRDVRPLVHLSNAITARWPADRPLEFMHAPLAAAVEPPPNRRSFYQPLERLRLAADTRFVAGFVHETLSIDAHHRLRGHLEGLVGRPIGVASSCGLGRRTPEEARACLDLAAELCDAPASAS